MKSLFLLFSFLFFSSSEEKIILTTIPSTEKIFCVWQSDGEGNMFMWSDESTCTYNTTCCGVGVSCTAGTCAQAKACMFAACENACGGA